MTSPAHGAVGKREQSFTQLLPLRANPYDPNLLANLADQMKSDPDTVKDGGDPEENLWVPAGYTYFGQFIDHDLTFDSTSSLDPNSAAEATNLRTPRFDLDCLYGDGPDAQPYMYDTSGTKLLYRHDPGTADMAKQDLLRVGVNGRAIIGDKRNDENSIVCQIQLAFVQYHNAVVEHLRQKANDENKPLTGGQLFAAARDQVRWTYQKLVMEDFLPRIVCHDVLKNLALNEVRLADGKKLSERDKAALRAKNYALYTSDKRGNLPLEFVGAAYRFGHSGVRTGYRMNDQVDVVTPHTKGGRFSIFPASDDPHPPELSGKESLLGFDPLPSNQEIDDWGRFFPDYTPYNLPENGLGPKAKDDVECPAVRLQHAYKIDTSIVDPLGALPRAQIAGEATTKEVETMFNGKLPVATATAGSPPRPSLALLNLLRGNSYRIASGQAVARELIASGFPYAELDKKYLCIRKAVEKKDAAGNAVGGVFKYEAIDEALQGDTPLWFYVLAEAQSKIVAALGLNGNNQYKEFNENEMLQGDGAKTQLGWVGGRIVAEVFYGLIDADPESYVNKAPDGWHPILDEQHHEVIFKNMLRFAAPRQVGTHD